MEIGSVPTTGRMTSAQREELIDQVKQQLAVATAQELLTVSLVYMNGLYSTKEQL